MIESNNWRKVRMLASGLMLAGLFSVSTASCGGDEPETTDKGNTEVGKPDKPSDGSSTLPAGFAEVTLTQAEGNNEIDLGWGIVKLEDQGYLAMKNGSALHQDIFQVGKMQSVDGIKKALYSGYPTTDDYRTYGQPLAGYGYLARGIYGSKNARLYVTKVEYSPLRVKVEYEKQWTAIPENARIHTYAHTISFGKSAFSSTNVVEITVELTAPLGYELVSKPEFVTEVKCEKNRMIVSIDITKNTLPNYKQRGEIILANEWSQSRVVVEFGGDY